MILLFVPPSVASLVRLVLGLVVTAEGGIFISQNMSVQVSPEKNKIRIGTWKSLTKPILRTPNLPPQTANTTSTTLVNYHKPRSRGHQPATSSRQPAPKFPASLPQTTKPLLQNLSNRTVAFNFDSNPHYAATTTIVVKRSNIVATSPLKRFHFATQ